MEPYRVGVSPHIRQEENTRSIMLDVCIALIPSLIWGSYVFGLRVLVIALIAVLSCVGLEWLSQKIMRRPVTVSDGSALVSGLLLAMNLPASVPLWLIPLGAAFAIVLVKQLFGGIGKNFVNPVLAARVFLFLSYPIYMSRFTEPFVHLDPFSISPDSSRIADAVTSATPLSVLKQGQIPENISITDLLTGSHAGCIGEGASFILLAGFLYLTVRKVITPHIPLSFLGTVALLSYLFPQAGGRMEFMIYSLSSGGLLLGAIFMATDYTTSPVTRGGKIVYGILCGALTVFIRFFGAYSEGVSFAILLSNLLVWYLDRLFRPRPYGLEKRFGTKKERAV